MNILRFKIFQKMLDFVLLVRASVILAKFGLISILFNDLDSDDFIIYTQISVLAYFTAILLGGEYSLVSGKFFARGNYNNTDSFKSHVSALKVFSPILGVTAFCLLLSTNWSILEKFLSIFIIGCNFYWLERYKISIFNNERNWVAKCLFVRELSWCLPIFLLYLGGAELTLFVVLFCWSGVLLGFVLLDWFYLIRLSSVLSELQTIKIGYFFLITAVVTQVVFKAPTTFDRFLFEKYMAPISLASYSYLMSLLLAGASIFDAVYFSKTIKSIMKGGNSGITKHGIVLLMIVTPFFAYLWGGAVYYFSLEYFSLIFKKELDLSFFWLAFITFKYSLFILVLSTLLLGFDFDYLSLGQKCLFLLFFIFSIFVLSSNFDVISWYAIAVSLGLYFINAVVVFLLIRKRTSL